MAQVLLGGENCETIGKLDDTATGDEIVMLDCVHVFENDEATVGFDDTKTDGKTILLVGVEGNCEAMGKLVSVFADREIALLIPTSLGRPVTLLCSFFLVLCCFGGIFCSSRLTRLKQKCNTSKT